MKLTTEIVSKNQKKKKKAPKISQKTVIMIIVAAFLLLAIGISSVFIIDYALIDTPYDGVNMSKHIKLPKYIGADLSKAKIDEEMAELRDGILDLFTKKDPVKTGTIQDGMNVNVVITAKLDGEIVKDVSYDAYEIADFGKHENKENQDFFDKLQAHIKATVTKIDFENPYFVNGAPAFTYKYADDFKVDKVKGKEVVHEIIITSVTTTDRPEFNDSLLKDNVDKIKEYLGMNVSFNTVEEFETYMRHQVELNHYWNNIIDAAEVIKYPSKFVSSYEDEYDEYYESVMAQNGITSWQTLYTQMGTTEAAYKAKRKEYAEGVVKEELALYDIIQSEGFRMTKAMYKEKGAALAKEAGYDSLDDYEDTLGKELAKRTVHWELLKEYLLATANRVA